MRITAHQDLPPGERIPVVLDTDIGSDVDDLLALVMLAGDPRVDLLAVTTVYGDATLRAQIAARVLRLLGRQVPVHAGEAHPLSGRKVAWCGHEDSGMDDLASELVQPEPAVEVLVHLAHQHRQRLVVVAIGPLTNVATALHRHPDLAADIGRLVVMGGEFTEGRPEHNLRSDVNAANTVLSAGIPSLFVGLDATTKVWFDESNLSTVAGIATPLAAVIDAKVREWWQFTGDRRNNPHDPLAILALTEPQHFTIATGGWRAVDNGEKVGALRPDNTAAAIHHTASVNADSASQSIVRRLANAVSTNMSD